MNWTQPLCDPCWVIREGARIAQRMRVDPDDPSDVCCDCGALTRAGIYILLDPRTVKYPTTE